MESATQPNMKPSANIEAFHWSSFQGPLTVLDLAETLFYWSLLVLERLCFFWFWNFFHYLCHLQRLFASVSVCPLSICIKKMFSLFAGLLCKCRHFLQLQCWSMYFRPHRTFLLEPIKSNIDAWSKTGAVWREREHTILQSLCVCSQKKLHATSYKWVILVKDTLLAYTYISGYNNQLYNTRKSKIITVVIYL